MLLNNLKDFHSGIEHEVQRDKAKVDTLLLPRDVLIIIMDFLDLDSLSKSFGPLCKQTERLKRHVIRSKLILFGNSFVFEQDWFNQDIYKFIKKHFPPNISIKRPEIYDHLELMTLKWILDEEQIELPRHIYFSVISFFHEIVFGLEAYVPISEDEWIASFGIKIQKYDLPLTKEFFFALHEKSQTRVSRNTIMALEFLSQKPSIEEQKEFYNQNEHLLRYFHQFFLIFRQKWTTGPLSNEEARDFLVPIPSIIGYPEAIIKNIKNPEQLSKFFKYRKSYSRIRKSIKFEKTNVRSLPINPFSRGLFRNSNFEVSNAFTYLWSRDLFNPFVLEEAQQFEDFDAFDLFFETVAMKMPLILQFDILAKLLRSGLMKLNEFSESSRALLNHAFELHLPIFELLMLESPTLINFVSPHGYNGSKFEDGLYMRKTRMALFFETQIALDNPLAVILLLGTLAERYKDLIVGKFNLDVKYQFDGEIPHFPVDWVGSSFAKTFKGRVLSFKKILSIFNKKSYKKAFGLDPFAVPVDSYSIANFPVHSFSAFVRDPNNALITDKADLLPSNFMQEIIWSIFGRV